MTTRARKATAKPATQKLADVELDKPTDPALDDRPADEKEPGGPERTVAQATASAAAEQSRRTRRSRRADVAAAQAAPEHPLTTGKVSVEDAARILRCYPEEVDSVDKTDRGWVATTTDGQHYLLGSDGSTWLEHPEQGLVQAS